MSLEKEEMGTRTKTLTKHFLHKHTLELSDDPDCEGSNCSVCKQPISDRRHYYRCSVCPNLCIHEHPCSKIPIHIDHHPFHPHHTLFFSDQVHSNNFCDACGANCYTGFVYKCLGCDFVLDVKCALLIPTTDTKNNHQNKNIQFQQQQQPHYPHPLISCDKDPNFSYSCCYCHLSIDGGWFYVCLQCKGLLHNSCAELPWEIEHPFHPEHPLVLLSQRRIMCSFCCQWRDGFAYRCSKCKFDLDVHCACLKPTEDNQSGSGQIQQFRHSHSLILCNNLENFPFTCFACGLPIADSIYFCPECCVLLHKSCADLPQEVKHHPLHPQHALTLRYRDGFRDTTNRLCQACIRCSYGFFFECSQCEWYMDVRCAFLSRPTILSRSRIHRHPLALISNTSATCNSCIKSCNTPFFRCVWCDLNYHVHCISALPPTLKYKYHVHPLTFTDCPIKDYPDEDDDAEFYCDACEERRDLAPPTYYCEECHYVAHPHCMISEIIDILEEEWLMPEKVEEPPALSLKEFLDSFTEEENKEVQGLFEEYRRNVRGESDILPKIFLSLYEDEDEKLDNDKILMYSEEKRCFAYLDKVTAWIMKKFVSEVEVTMPWENWDSTSKVMKKFVSEVVVRMPWENWDSHWHSTSKVIEDGNYMIFENQLSILKALFSKYGDFSKSSRLSAKAIMFFIMIVCEAVHSMCNTKVADITTSLLLTWFHSFALAQEAGFEIEFVIARLTKLVRAHVALQVDHAPVDPNLNFEELAIIEQDGETDDLRNKVDAVQLTIIKLDEAIEELEKKKKALLKMREEKECLINALELQGQMAAGSILL